MSDLKEKRSATMLQDPSDPSGKASRSLSDLETKSATTTSGSCLEHWLIGVVVSLAWFAAIEGWLRVAG